MLEKTFVFILTLYFLDFELNFKKFKVILELKLIICSQIKVDKNQYLNMF